MGVFTETNYTVKLETFEGPLDLLLSLIEKRKMLVNDVSLSKVADDFIGYVRDLGRFPIAESAQFLLVASTLLLIKSKSLLPTLDLTDEENESVSDLEARLKLYQRIKELSLNIKERFGKNIIFQPKVRPQTIVFSPDESMTLSALVAALKNALMAMPEVEKLPQALVKKVISLEEMIENLTERIQSSIKMSFKDFASFGKTEKVNVIVSFLAMLELVKQGIIAVSQESDFGDIEMETKSVSVPKYN